MTIYEKLLKIQTELKVPKSQYNKFGNYYYRNCEDIQEALKPLMKEVKATLIIRDEIIKVEERYYIKAIVQFIDCETGEKIENYAFAREEGEKKGMDVSQVTGSTSSYARKYALNGLFCIDDVKDADNDNNKDNQKQQKTTTNKNNTSPKITQPMINTIQSLIEKYASKGLKIEKILKSYQLKDIKDMNIEQFKHCMNQLSLYEKQEEKVS